MSRPEAPPTEALPADASPLVIEAFWDSLRQHTAARVALGRAGPGLPTQHHLSFQVAHAQARDAVHLELDAQALVTQLSSLGGECLAVHSAAPDRLSYLQRPDLGRRLDARSREMLIGRSPSDGAAAPDGRAADLAIVVADGLSALAVGRHAPPLLQVLLPQVRALGWRIAPLVVAEQARVALADEIGELLQARMVVILIGERPGLSSPDSMGLYLTWMPRVGRTDADRNCISNVRPEGLPCHEAANRLLGLMQRARALALTGVALKDDSVRDEQLPCTPRVSPA